MRIAVVLFTRDLRVHDHPALAAACKEADKVVPLFVFDDDIWTSDYARPNRTAFLLESLSDLAASLTERGAGLVVRRGELVEETLGAASDAHAEGIFLSADASAFATRRWVRLKRACEGTGIHLRSFPGTSGVSPGDVTPSNGDHFRVFTPYYRRWKEAPRRALSTVPGRIDLPNGLRRDRMPRLGDLVDGRPSPDLAAGGETAGRARLTSWLRSGLEGYADDNNDLSGDKTSRLSPYLHFGCLSARTLEDRAGDRPGGTEFIRQLCWRDFYLQVLAAMPDFPRREYRSQDDRWERNDSALGAWKEGMTGYPIVDAGMRQLAREGFMHNRARLITGSFLCKDLYIDWRAGAAHFWDLLIDGDIASNSGNWQWVAGTGNDTRPQRMFNPLRQAERFDPRGDYVRRYVPELASVEGKAVHEPWKLGPLERATLDYPEPIVDHTEAVRQFRRKRLRRRSLDSHQPSVPGSPL